MSKPNILLIVADQQRYDCLGYAGMMPVRTPNIDRLAAGGTWFEHAYTSIPTCCPARQSLMSGRTAESLRAYWNYDITMPVASLTPDTPTWPAMLEEAGYRNAFIGKWHVSPDFGPLDFGYEYFYGVKDYEHRFRSIVPNHRFTEGSLGESDPAPLHESRTHVYADLAIERIREYHASGTPWHVRLDFPEPHPPYRPAREYDGMYAPEDVIRWGSFDETFRHKPFIQRKQLENWGVDRMSWDDWAPTVARYYSVITQMDDAIGRVLSALDESGAADNTFIIFTSDHGDMTGGHRMMDKHYVMYDDVVRVPLLVVGPDIRTQRCRELVSNTLDLMPTILDLAEIGTDGDRRRDTAGRDEREDRAERHARGNGTELRFHGRSLAPILHGETPEDWPEEAVSTHNGSQFGLYSQRMIRTRRWKYIWNLTAEDELYDLKADPHELENVIDEDAHREVRLDLKRRLYRRLKTWDDPLLKGPWLEPQLLEEGSILKWEMPPTY